MPDRTAKKKAVRRRASADRAINGRDMTAGNREPTRSEAYTAARNLNGAAVPTPEVRCTLAPMEGAALLLPTNVVAEVIEFVQPEPVLDTPKWFLGQIVWENRQIPVFSYSALISGADPAAAGARARIVIVKSLAVSARVPYLGIVICDIPKLLTVQPAELVHTGDERKSLGVYCHVTVQEQAAVIPDLERLTHLVTHAAYGELPITHLDA
jgi:chemosensory pili system protein ChpC